VCVELFDLGECQHSAATCDGAVWRRSPRLAFHHHPQQQQQPQQSVTNVRNKLPCRLCIAFFLVDWVYQLLERFFMINGVTVFTARCYASAVIAMALCLSVCLSVTSRSSTKTAKRRITETTPHDTPGTLVFWRQRFPRNSTGVTPYEGAKRRWGGSKSATFDK